MKKLVLFSVGMLAFALLSVNATNTILYSTDDDWTSWDSVQGLTFQDTTAFDYDGVTVNGIGNSSNPGGAGTGGALEVSPIVPCNWGQAGPAFGLTGPTTAVLVAMDGPGADYNPPFQPRRVRCLWITRCRTTHLAARISLWAFSFKTVANGVDGQPLKT